MMTEKELIGKLQELRQIKPRKDWVVLTKNQILGESARGQASVSFFPIWKPALVTVTAFGILFGIFAFAQNALPGDILYPIKKIAEKSQAAFVSEKEKPIIQLELVNKRLEELNKIAENNQLKNLPPALTELKTTKLVAKKEVSNILKNKPEKEAIKVAKEIALKLKEINKKEKQVLTSLRIESEETNQEPTEKVIAELLIKDLEERTLNEKQQKILQEAKEDYKVGKYSQTLEKILEISQI